MYTKELSRCLCPWWKGSTSDQPPARGRTKEAEVFGGFPECDESQWQILRRSPMPQASCALTATPVRTLVLLGRDNERYKTHPAQSESPARRKWGIK